jgi:hypothetical protein
LEAIRRIEGLQVRVGGEPHSGWLPAGAAQPLPTPVRDVVMDLEIQFDGDGYLLCYASRDSSIYGDTWHKSAQEAEQAAADSFGADPSLWRDA